MGGCWQGEEQITARANKLKGVRKVPELRVSQVLTNDKGPEKKSGGLVHRKVGGESEQAGVQRYGRNGAMEEHQSERNQPRVEKLSDKLQEEVLEKHKVEVSKRGSCKGRGEPSEWRLVQRVKHFNLGNGVKTAGRESFRGSGNMICSKRKACRKA